MNKGADLANVILPAGVNVIAGVGNKRSQYVMAEQFSDRIENTVIADKTNVTADGTDEITLSSIPDNATIKIIGEGLNLSEPLTSPTDTITFDTTGVYKITVSAFPYLDHEVTINAN